MAEQVMLQHTDKREFQWSLWVFKCFVQMSKNDKDGRCLTPYSTLTGSAKGCFKALSNVFTGKKLPVPTGLDESNM